MTVATRKRLETGTKVEAGVRFATLVAKALGEATSPLDQEARTLTLSWSSEYPVERWFGEEILDHSPGSANLDRLNDGAPLLFNHNMNDVIGVIEPRSARIGADRKGHAVVRFARTPRGDEMMAMVADNVLRNVSFMYQVNRFVADINTQDGGDDTYRAVDWEPYEISLVSIPADPTVGVGRAAAPSDSRAVVVEPAASRATRSPPLAAPAALTQEETMKLKHLLRNAAGADGPAAGSPAPASATPAVNAPVVDAARIAAEANQAASERIAAIYALRQKHNLPQAFIDDVIKRGLTLPEVRGLVLDHITTQDNRAVANFDHQRVDLSDKEARSYSLVRAVNAIIAGDWSKAGFEREVSVTIAKSLQRDPRQHGFFIPSNLPFIPTKEHARALQAMGGPLAQRMVTRATYSTSVAGQGGNLVETTLLEDSFIEVLRNMSVVMQLGARMLSGLVGGIDIPRQNGVTTTYWVGESGAITQSEGTFDKVSLRPKTIGALSKMSRLMLLQSTPAIEMLAREDLIAQMALGIDLAALSGSGTSNQPTGIVNQSGVGSVVGGTNGAALTFDHLIQLYTQPAVGNAPMGSMAFAINAKTKGFLATLKSTTGQYLWNPSGNSGGVSGMVADNVQGYPYMVSNQLRSNLTKGTATGIASELIFGNWRELLIGEWGVTELTVNPFGQTDFANGDVAIRAFQTLDIAVRHGVSFSTMSDALTTGF